MDLNFHTEKSKIKIKAHDNQVIRTDDALPKTHLIWCIIGRKGSGKSSIVLTALKTKQDKGGYKKYFDNIFMVSPTGMHDKKFKKLIDELDEDGHYYDTLNEGTISEIRQKLETYNSENEGKDIHNLLILDDCMAHLPPSQSKQATLNNMFILSRHLKLSIWVTGQKYTGLSRTIRTQCDLVSFFRTDNKAELKTLIDDVNVDEDTLKALYDFATKDSKNDFLHINMLSNPVTYFKKFDKILL
jgi:ABC-type dipeptide/oligopeptide/nickel transport system ATPase component